MKKRYKIGISVVVAVMLVIALIPVAITEYWFLGPEPKDEEGLKLRARQVRLLKYVKNNFPEATLKDIDEITFQWYYGCYNGCIVASYDHGKYEKNYIGTGYETLIEGYVFEQSRSTTIMVYKDGEFYNLYDAYYKAKVLTYEDLKALYARYKELFNIKYK